MGLRRLNAFLSSLGLSVEILPTLRTPCQKVRFYDHFEPKKWSVLMEGSFFTVVQDSHWADTTVHVGKLEQLPKNAYFF